MKKQTRHCIVGKLLILAITLIFCESIFGMSSKNTTRSHIDIIIELLQNPKFNVKSPLEEIGGTPLYWAIWFDRIDVVEKLLERKAPLVNVRFEDGSTPLYLATLFNHETIALALIRHGANVNRRDTSSGKKPLHAAAKYGHTKLARILVQHGANANARDFKNRTPSVLAEDHEYCALAKWLRKCEAKQQIKQQIMEAAQRIGCEPDDIELQIE